MLTNFHTHNYRCKHASGNAFDYIQKAIDENYHIIGLSDHAPLSYYTERMDKDELIDYLEEVEQAKAELGSLITIYSGLEIEYFKEFEDVYRTYSKQVDYLVLGLHDFFYKGVLMSSYEIQNDQQLGQYFETMFEAIKSGYFTFVAHPDLFAFNYHMTDMARLYTHQLAKLCLETDMILEFNANGLRKGIHTIGREDRYLYPYLPFWEIIGDYRIKVIVNSDCHDPHVLNDTSDQMARMMAKELNLNIVYTIFK